MLIISNLTVAISADQVIINDLSIQIEPGTIHALMGPNGSGKTTLAYTLMGHPRYQVTEGSIVFNGQDMVNLSPDKRAHAGMFLSFQHPYEIPGVSISSFLKEAYQAVKNCHISPADFQKLLTKKMELLSIDSSFAHRNVNEGFSGGEKKRLEMLQLLILQPKLVILDEIDSGLDSDALKFVTQALQQAKAENPTLTIIVITHYPRMLSYLVPDFVHVMIQGKFVASGDVSLSLAIEEKGYDGFQ